MWTERDDKEIKYGEWNEFTAKDTLAEEYKIRPPRKIKKSWPHWSEGVPIKLCRKVGSPHFFVGAVHHWPTEYYQSIELEWKQMHKLSSLRSNYRLLPSLHQSEWSGVYRIFAPDASINRCCGEDPTGTLYIGLAAHRGRNWSVLRTRIMSIVNCEHHAMRNWSSNELLRQKYSWESLAVQWAYTGQRLNYKGEPFPEARMAEGWLLDCYSDSYGELPPWNQRG